jgi:hypothetical protein
VDTTMNFRSVRVGIPFASRATSSVSREAVALQKCSRRLERTDRLTCDLPHGRRPGDGSPSGTLGTWSDCLRRGEGR